MLKFTSARQHSAKAPFHQQVKSNELEKTKVVVPSVLKLFAGKGEKWEDTSGGKALFSSGDTHTQSELSSLCSHFTDYRSGSE